MFSTNSADTGYKSNLRLGVDLIKLFRVYLVSIIYSLLLKLYLCREQREDMFAGEKRSSLQEVSVNLNVIRFVRSDLGVIR